MKSTISSLQNISPTVVRRLAITKQGLAGPPFPAEDMHLLERLASEQVAEDVWLPRTTLLSPFDNLICDRKRTDKLFNFHYRSEIYTPKHKRKYGYYVLPILHGDQLIGRVDPKMDRKQGCLLINAIYAEADLPTTQDKAVGQAVFKAIESLATFLEAKEVVYLGDMPGGWR